MRTLDRVVRAFSEASPGRQAVFREAMRIVDHHGVAEMRRGPRGGGRDRDRIIRHTIRTESEDFAKQVGLRIPEEAALTPEGLRQHRESYIAAMRAYNAGEVERRMRSWTLAFLIRHSAFHTLDHAWEMEDKDLTAETAGGPR